ncbi:hypothetical protein PINS_up009724 [Pythium insidiosum]|nr:hypothetical protein PINS_up009724 [Pythium insidiosum]
MEDVGDLHLGALYGRYKNWRRVVDDAPAPDAADTAADGDASVSAAMTPDRHAGDALVVTFEATAKEDLRVGFAARGSSQWRYEIALGFSGNTEVAVRKCVGAGRELELAKVFSGRTVATTAPVAYWVVLHGATLALGVGATVGRDTVIRCVDPKADERSGLLADVQQLAFTTWHQGASVKRLTHAVVDAAAAAAIRELEQLTPRVIVRGDPLGHEDLLSDEQRGAFERELEVAQRRVARFGGELVVPDVKKFLDPKVIRRLQRTGGTEHGFATGLDVLSAAETEKREARMKRFNTPQFAVEFSTDAARALSDGLSQDEWAAREAEREKLRERARKFGLDPDANPKSADAVMDLRPASRKVRLERCDVKADGASERRDDAIHVYSLDERFQQVRTNDVMAYFEGYGPWYVEWINDSSCTVVFEDAFTAGRALIALGKEIPSQTIKQEPSVQQEPAIKDEPSVKQEAADDHDVDMADASADADATATAMEEADDEREVPDEAFNRSEWRYGQPVRSATQPSHKTWRLLLRRATADDFPPEKTHKKYHDRRSLQGSSASSASSSNTQRVQKGRGHRDAQHKSNRSHPYRRRR